MNRRGQAVLMLLIGAAVLQNSLTDGYLRFVKPGMRPLLVAAALLLGAAAGMTLWYQSQEDPAHPVSDPELGDAGHHHADEPRVAWLLLVPVAVLALVAPPALGADAAGRSGTALAPPTSDFAPLPEGDPVSIGVREYASRAVFDEGRSLQGRTVQVLGFIIVGEDGVIYLARMIVSCCAADARPVKVGLTGEVPPGLRPDAWVSVRGKYTTRTAKDPVNGATIPFIELGEAQPVEPPTNPYQT